MPISRARSGPVIPSHVPTDGLSGSADPCSFDPSSFGDGDVTGNHFA